MVADQVLAAAPWDEDAVRCKVMAHIKSDKALAAIRAAERLPIDLSYYKAYCYYRQNKLQEALDVQLGRIGNFVQPLQIYVHKSWLEVEYWAVKL